MYLPTMEHKDKSKAVIKTQVYSAHIAVTNSRVYISFRAVEVVERRYIFLKRLCQVLCALGGQLCSLVVSLNLATHFFLYLHGLLSGLGQGLNNMGQ